MTGARVRSRAPVSGAVIACLVLALTGIGAARVPAAEPEALCVPLLTDCGSPTPTPTPTPGSTQTGPLGGLGSVLGVGGAETPGGSLTDVVARPDPDAPTMTLPAAQLGGSSMSFTGLQSVTVVTVPLANGKRTPVLKLVADSITINDFLLDVRPASTSGALVTNSGRMVLTGHVVAYLDSVSATLLGGAGITLGVASPPPGGELPSTLLRPTLGLVGVTARSITLTPSDEAVK
ncbi:MAG: hypothetical protein JWR36_1691 [Glaciihabitans sp.]|nr:hypothetical protein [Glaciihabitans sp.]